MDGMLWMHFFQIAGWTETRTACKNASMSPECTAHIMTAASDEQTSNSWCEHARIKETLCSWPKTSHFKQGAQVQSNRRHANCISWFQRSHKDHTTDYKLWSWSTCMQPRYAQNQTGGTKSQVKKIYCRWMEQHADEIVLDASHLIKQPKLHKFIQNSL